MIKKQLKIIIIIKVQSQLNLIAYKREWTSTQMYACYKIATIK